MCASWVDGHLGIAQSSDVTVMLVTVMKLPRLWSTVGRSASSQAHMHCLRLLTASRPQWTLISRRSENLIQKSNTHWGSRLTDGWDPNHLENNVFVVTVLCKRLKTSNISFFDCPFYSIIRGQHFSLFGPNYQQRDLRLFFEQNSHQLGFVAHHIHLCFQARMSDESQLAPHPRL